MIDLSQFICFEWDKGNLDKNYKKHGISLNQAEEAFLAEEFLLLEDIKHSTTEKRWAIMGTTIDQSFLFIIFTIRKDTIRIISARKANKKERRYYEETFKKHS